jgi:hypothetical protein
MYEPRLSGPEPYRFIVVPPETTPFSSYSPACGRLLQTFCKGSIYLVREISFRNDRKEMKFLCIVLVENSFGSEMNGSKPGTGCLERCSGMTGRIGQSFAVNRG